METILSRLQASIALFEADEKPITSAQCNEALSVVADLQAALQQIPAWRSFLELTLLLPQSPRRETSASNGLSAPLIVWLSYACEQVDRVRMQLAVFASHAGSRALPHQSERHAIQKTLQALLQAVSQVQALGTPTQRPRVRPDYLRVVPDGEDSQDEQRSPVERRREEGER
jgi:hypothetical protein